MLYMVSDKNGNTQRMSLKIAGHLKLCIEPHYTCSFFEFIYVLPGIFTKICHNECAHNKRTWQSSRFLALHDKNKKSDDV